jgi:hypothetical protein
MTSTLIDGLSGGSETPPTTCISMDELAADRMSVATASSGMSGSP